jgi:gamma-glutamylcyclotransferase (GGCT)/AIG2-like uncharacterized protein YtfP
MALDAGEAMVERLFVYGSLGPGRPNEHVLAEIGGSWEVATVTGTLREEGWGAAMGFPGIQLGEDGSEVRGFLFTSENLSAHWAALDEFEGASYERVLTRVKLQDNTAIDAYIYALRSRTR